VGDRPGGAARGGDLVLLVSRLGFLRRRHRVTCPHRVFRVHRAIALGEAIVIFAGEIDLSTGALSSLVGIAMAELWRQGLNIWLAVVIALVIAALCGAINGPLVTRFGIASLLVTLATQFIFSSVATAWGGGSPPYGFPKSFVDITGTGTIGPIPDQLILFAVIAARRLL